MLFININTMKCQDLNQSNLKKIYFGNNKQRSKNLFDFLKTEWR